jgi:hypothetical protein
MATSTPTPSAVQPLRRAVLGYDEVSGGGLLLTRKVTKSLWPSGWPIDHVGRREQ